MALFRQASCFDSTGAKHHGIAFTSNDFGLPRPKSGLLRPPLARELDVSVRALTVPDIDTEIGLMHTLFTLEDTSALKIGEIDGELCIRLDKHSPRYPAMFELLSAWQKEAEKLAAGEITQADYDRWRRYYPTYDQDAIRAKIPPELFTADLGSKE